MSTVELDYVAIARTNRERIANISAELLRMADNGTAEAEIAAYEASLRKCEALAPLLDKYAQDQEQKERAVVAAVAALRTEAAAVEARHAAELFNLKKMADAKANEFGMYASDRLRAAISY